MEPGDLRINSRLMREDNSGGGNSGGVPKHSPGGGPGGGGVSYSPNDGPSQHNHFRNHNVRQQAVITDGRYHHLPLPLQGNPLVLDRNEPVKVWRDPALINSGEIRHVVSMQHSGVVHLSHQPPPPHPHPMVAHSNVSSGAAASAYQQHQQQLHESKQLESASREHSINTADVLRGRTPVMYVPHPGGGGKPPPPMEAWRPSVVQNSKDFRVNLTSKSTVEQAVHDHFVESLRLAHLKGGTTPQGVSKHEEEQQQQQHRQQQHQQQQQQHRQNHHPNQHMASQMQRFYPPPHDKRHHDIPSPQVMYQIHQQQQAQAQAQAQAHAQAQAQAQALAKSELPAPPPLRNNEAQSQYRTGLAPGPSPELSRKQHQIYGAPDIGRSPHDQQSSIIRYSEHPNSEPSRLDHVLPSENCVRSYQQKLHPPPPAPSPRRHQTTQNDLQQQQQQQLERNRSPFAGKQPTPVISPNSYHHNIYNQAHLSKLKVNSPAPQHLYGKPGPGPSPRTYEMVSNEPQNTGPLPLTSKGGLTRPTQASPTHYSPSLPQHEMRKSDVAYYMYNNGPPASATGFQQRMSPQAQAQMHAVQTQPLDLGGKRKLEDDYPVQYKVPIPEYDHHRSDQATIKSVYGSLKPPPPLPHSHPNHASLTISELGAPKRKFEDPMLPSHFDPKKLRNDNTTTVISSTNLIIGRSSRELESKFSPGQGPSPGPIRSHIVDNISSQPVSLLVNSGGKPEITHHNLPVDIKKPASVIAGPPNLDTHPHHHPSVITTAVNLKPSPPVCNGTKEKEKNQPSLECKVAVPPAPATSPPEPEQKTQIVQPEVVKVKQEPVSIPAAGTSTSSTTASSATSTSTKFQKVPKKAWVLQWHEADATSEKADEEKESKPTITGDVGSDNSTSNITTPASEDKPKSEQNQDEECSSEKLTNGNSETEGKSQSPTSTSPNSNTPTLPLTTISNGIVPSKEKLDSDDVGSENESDNSSKDKLSGGLDNGAVGSTTPTKKNGRNKLKENSSSPNKPDLRKDGLFKRPPVLQLKKTGESFIQAETCNRVTPKIGKCRECRWHPSGRGNKRQSGAYCRFYGFRKLRYTKGGSLTVAGFSDPYTDPAKITEHDQFQLWLPSTSTPEGMDVTISKFLLTQLSHQFCDLVQQEEEARSLATAQELSVVAWKPLLKGVREMCDVCDTTLFNFHWACGKCGFVVCLSCFKTRKNQNEEEKAITENAGKDRDEFQWLLCSNRLAHELDKLMLVQTIAGDALTDLNEKLHSVCSNVGIKIECGCKGVKVEVSNSTENSQDKLENTSEETEELKTSPKKEEGDDSSKNDKSKEENGKSSEDSENLEYFIRPLNRKLIKEQAPRLSNSFVISESPTLYPTVKHSWLCNGKLLRLEEASSDSAESPEIYEIFQEMWKRGQPVLVSNISSKLDNSLWSPESFSRDFGDFKSDLVNCSTGEVVTNQQMKKFWEGFSSLSKRLKDDDGEPMILKLKEWPVSDDFSQVLPTRFGDLVGALPLKEYTLKEGKRNLAARLPQEFMKPDLGPKMCIAYGLLATGSTSGLEDKGTTNLHLDISDQVNILVHCEAPQDTDQEEHNKAVVDAIKESDCDVVTVDRILQKKEVPGAIWHLFEAKDADKIRDFLNKVATEKGQSVEKSHDGIHSQSWYLDNKLRKRLQAEYDVSGYAILQCAGDAIFVPAGAPHQVRNLQNCIKVGEDFISPENISHSLYLSEEEFYNLSKTHSTREDKLQIKNIVYHTVKDAVTVLLNNEKSESKTNSSSTSKIVEERRENTIESSINTTALPKDCQNEKSTSPG